MRVHQLLSGAGPVDAVTGQAIAIRRRLTAWGWAGQDVAVFRDPRVGDAIGPLSSLRRRPGDLQVLHYSAYAPRLRRLLDAAHPTLLISHNVTPARYLWDHEPGEAIVCALGRRQLADFVAAARVSAGVSAYNAGELAEAGAVDPVVVPLFIDFEPMGHQDDSEDPPAPPTVLCVGRLTPHKRHDEVIRAFARYRLRHAPEARLELVGEAVGPRYRAAVASLADELAPGAVRISSGLSRQELGGRYRAAHVLLSLSEHEGFCLPLIEAFHHGVPVVARGAAAVPETTGDAALLVSPEDDDAVVAELIHLAVSDVDLRRELRRRGRARLADYGPQRAEQALRAALERVGRGRGAGARGGAGAVDRLNDASGAPQP